LLNVWGEIAAEQGEFQSFAFDEGEVVPIEFLGPNEFFAILVFGVVVRVFLFDGSGLGFFGENLFGLSVDPNVLEEGFGEGSEFFAGGFEPVEYNGLTILIVAFLSVRGAMMESEFRQAEKSGESEVLLFEIVAVAFEGAFDDFVHEFLGK
jgi:hypothetical protein